MARHYDDLQHSSVKTRRQQEDQRRMEFRRAIEMRDEERRLNQTFCDYLNLDSLPEQHWQVSPSSSGRQSARPAG